MKSLRVQLLVGTALGTALVLLVSGALLYALISRALWAAFDHALAAKARSLTALAEQDQGRLEFDLAEVKLPEFEPSGQAEFFQVWLPHGTVFARSASLCGTDLDRIAGTLAAPAFQTVRLPDGRSGRIVGLTFVPRQEADAGRGSSPLSVTLVLGRDIAGLQATLVRMRAMLVCVGLVAVVLSAGALAWVVRRNLRPIDDLSRQIAAVAEHDLSTRIAVRDLPRELLPVAERLNDLLARLDAAFQRERRFTGDVAHELRTPLAGLRSKLELALARARAPEEYQKTTGDCLKISLQMQRMVENLLHLARADAGQLEIRRTPVDLSQVVGECWEPLEARARARGLSVERKLHENSAVETDRDKLRLVLQNVLENAVLYANEGGRISLVTTAADGHLTFAASNTGSSLPPAEVHHVFERFWRGDASSRGGAESHCGLGLPLCQAVIEQLGGSIEATADAAGVFTVTIHLPRA
ncbi:MAG: sensor histidine kinase N-terminal domain-containing protein [Planctomycetes bacterium]|nr:sensor histidine kinase N-terminal domain-containing protein [Planctomycetota bacterium]